MQKTYKIIPIMKDVVANIVKIRKQKGYTQENMADEMQMTQATYSRIESGEAKLTLERLQEIADILKTDITTFFDSSKISIQNQTNNEGAYGNGYVENLIIENKETVNKLIQTLENENRHLKNEIEFLRSMIK